MLEYEDFIYLQNHKTGCTYVETFLRKFCKQPRIAYNKHAALSEKPGKFCFVNVRNPLNQYTSLFAYGLRRIGLVRLNLRRSGNDHFYKAGKEGFPEWLRFVLDPKNAALLDARYTPSVASMMGFMTWRFLRLACPGLQEAAPQWTEHAQMDEYVARNNVIGAVLRTERLGEDLAGMVRGRLRPYISDVPEALRWIGGSGKTNTSDSDGLLTTLTREDVVKALRREETLIRSFYPQVLGRKTARTDQSSPGGGGM